MQRVPARLFGPGLAAGGEAVELELSDSALAVLGRPGLAVALSQVTLTLAGFGLDEWQLAWQQDGAHVGGRLGVEDSVLPLHWHGRHPGIGPRLQRGLAGTADKSLRHEMALSRKRRYSNTL